MSEGGIFSFVRCVKVRDRRSLVATTRHAQGVDKSSIAHRVEGRPFRALVYVPESDTYETVDPAPLPPPPEDEEARKAWVAPPPHPLVDLVARHDQWKEQADARHRKGTPIALHFITGVSPSWVTEEGGGSHNPENPRIRALLRAAADWCTEATGTAPFHVRFDLDERGTAVVDVVVSPTSDYSNGRTGKVRTWISTGKALAKLQGERDKSFQGLQDSWAEFAATRLDPRLQRGRPKKETLRDHVLSDDYGTTMDEIHAEITALEDARGEAEAAAATAKVQQAGWRQAHDEAIEARARAERAAARLRRRHGRGPVHPDRGPRGAGRGARTRVESCGGGGEGTDRAGAGGSGEVGGRSGDRAGADRAAAGGSGEDGGRECPGGRAYRARCGQARAAGDRARAGGRRGASGRLAAGRRKKVVGGAGIVLALGPLRLIESLRREIREKRGGVNHGFERLRFVRAAHAVVRRQADRRLVRGPRVGRRGPDAAVDRDPSP